MLLSLPHFVTVTVTATFDLKCCVRLAMTKAQAGCIFASILPKNCLASPVIGIVSEVQSAILLTVLSCSWEWERCSSVCNNQLSRSVFFAIAGLGGLLLAGHAGSWGDSPEMDWEPCEALSSLVEAGSSLGWMACRQQYVPMWPGRMGIPGRLLV